MKQTVFKSKPPWFWDERKCLKSNHNAFEMKRDVLNNHTFEDQFEVATSEPINTKTAQWVAVKQEV